jgi:hypothetical protein
MLATASSKGPGVGDDELAPSSESASTPRDGRDDPTSAPVRKPSQSRMERIARRAHEIYEARGGQHGKATEDWLQAEREIDVEMEAPK